MLHTIHDFANPMLAEINRDFITSANDIPITDLVVMVMKEYEAVSNIEILDYEVILDPDKIDINEHSININYKRKSGPIEIPKYKYIATNRVGEIRFTIRIRTNKEERTLIKKILIPIEYEGFYALNNKKWKTLWQLVDASTYSQKGKITLKSRMPIIIYKSKKRLFMDSDGDVVEYSTFSYALNGKARRGAKARVKFINPLMIFASKVGLENTIKYFDLQDVVSFVEKEEAETHPFDGTYRYFYIDELTIRVNRHLVDNIPMVGSFVAMMVSLGSYEFPVTKEQMNDTNYWRCRIGAIGAAHSKTLSTFFEKGKTTIYMVERLLDSVTQMNLRLPNSCKKDIYALLRWMITDFDHLKNRNNMDLANKRIRKNEYIVMASLGKKVSENINKLIEKLSKSKLNTMDTLLELFNFPSDIIVSGMRNIGDLVKADELVNDMTMLQDLYFSAKGPNSLGEQSSRIISQKYRNIHPSYIGKIDINVSSNSDVGMSGAFTPFVHLYDGFYFNPEREPYSAQWQVHNEIAEYYNSDAVQAFGFPQEIVFDNPDDFLAYMDKQDETLPGLKYEDIRIVEKAENTLPSVVALATQAALLQKTAAMQGDQKEEPAPAEEEATPDESAEEKE